MAWQDGLIWGQNAPKACPENVHVLLADHPAWKGSLGWCERRQKPMLLRDVGRFCKAGPWLASYDTEFVMWAARCLENGIVDRKNAPSGLFFNQKMVATCIERIALEHRFDPVRDYLTRLEWDSTPRLDSFLTKYCGAPERPECIRAGRAWMISAVARVYQPGCQADHALVLESGQGERKTTLFRVLGGEWSIEHYGELVGINTLLTVHAAWIIELADLASLKRAREIEAVKAMLTTRRDTLVLKYQNHSVVWPRRFVFAGTVNPGALGWIADQTGGRRFWPVPVRNIQIHSIEDIRDQLWAEAVAMYNEREEWWISDIVTQELIAKAQAARLEGGDEAWEEIILEYLGASRTSTIRAICANALDIAKGDVDKRTEMRVASILKKNGFSRKENVIRNGKQGCYWEIDDDPL